MPAEKREPVDDTEEADLEARRPQKRLRPNRPDRLSSLSDEILLRTLSFLPISDLILCERCAFDTSWGIDSDL